MQSYENIEIRNPKIDEHSIYMFVKKEPTK